MTVKGFGQITNMKGAREYETYQLGANIDMSAYLPEIPKISGQEMEMEI